MPILSWDANGTGARLRQALAPERWPFDPALLPAGSMLVGGAVRDALLGRLGETPDLDVVVDGDAVALARSLARRCGGTCVVLDAERSIARLVLRGWNLDLARRMGADLATDLRRRDYSVNALALPLPAPGREEGGDLIDATGGLADLQAGRLRALGEANLLEDPLRLLRGPRLACELGFTLEPATRAWITAHRLRLGSVAGERVLAELERLAAAPGGGEGLALTLELGLLESWGGAGGAALPLLAGLTPQGARAAGLSPAEAAGALALARLAAVLGGEALGRLPLSRRLQQRISRLRRWRRQLLEPQGEAASDGAEGRAAEGCLAGLGERERLALQRDLEEDWPALALHLQPADAQESLRRWRQRDDPLFHPRPPLDGLTLQRRLALRPGRELGELLEHLSAERAFRRLPAEGGQERILEACRSWLESRGGSAAGPRPLGPPP